ncbi:uncharacterized protein N7458_010967 [Penicillium daleae]|uniref:Yeast cell wall synthesis Kre9/Knh1-like N-terminal domain-containing protein n=1 Tax=Penicillium daleae TaxID=63821 RepID=A0AAD6BZZ7_9EURO|nr:uncharacterized protein N7458_010967 [Penicillium daleae]KAJ5439969.1 hypothetical protein N7458_010967 [Penicillium daleae]
MRLSLALSLLPLAGFVGALHVTEPEKGADIKTSSSLAVKWTFVDTDAKSFDLYLVNNAVYPSINKKIASNVETSDGSYTIDSLTGVSAGQGYQINLQSDESMNTGILAQSEQFNVTGSTQSSSTSSSSTSSSSTSSSSTSTSSGTTTGSTTTNTLITSTTSTGTSTNSETTGTSGATGARSSSGASASGTSSQTSVPSTGAAAALVAHPVAVAGLLAGALAFGL